MKKFLISLFFFCMAGAASATVTCTTTLNPGAQVNVGATVASAANGAVICLNGGTYNWTQGTDAPANEQQFENIVKSPAVTIMSTPGQTAVFPGIQVSTSQGLTFKNITIQSGEVHDFSGSPKTKNIKFEGVTFPQPFSVNMTGNSNANILFDRCIFGADGYRGSEVGTLGLTCNPGTCNGTVSGIRVQHSLFDGTNACADGIQVTGDHAGTIIGPGNVFKNWIQLGVCGAHVDSYQIVSSGGGMTLEGNYFVNNSVNVGFYDGGAANSKIVNNIFDTPAGSGESFQIGGVQGMLFAHNTLHNITNTGIGTKSGLTHNSGWIIENNVLVNSVLQNGGSFNPGCGSDCIRRFNLLSNGSAITLTGGSNTNTITATAVFSGTLNSPSDPTVPWPNWALAGGSPGENAANDTCGVTACDMGILYFNPAPPTVTVN